MTPSTAIVSAPAGSVDGLALLVEAANSYAADSKASATRRAYAADWRAFVAWCQGKGLASLPAAPAVVAVYVADLAESGRRVSTVERALAGIAHAHRADGHPWQKGQAQIREVMAGIRRRHGVAPAQKVPVTDVELALLVGTLGVDRSGLRDRALLTVAWFAALRRSELVALDLADVTFIGDGLVVTVRRGKTDQDGQGRAIGVPYASAPALCPVRALRAWLDVSGVSEGPIFDLSDRAVARLVKRAAAAAGLDPERFAGHSLRAGFATTAAKKGKSLDAIMRQTGHRSERVARGYIRHARLFDDNAAVGLI